MRVEAHDNLGKQIKSNISRLVVYDDFDNPIIIVLKWGKGMCHTSRVGDAEFNNLLGMLGIDKTVIVDKLTTSQINENSPTKVII